MVRITDGGLLLKDWHLVFVYGTLLQGLSNHTLLDQARFLGQARTKRSYALYVDYFPKVIRDEALSSIVGELYLVDGPTLALLDDLEDHPFEYRREQVVVIMDDGAETPAWIYFHPRPGGYLVTGGDLRAWLRGQADFSA
jgi:gamma-glutamylaminecyclotransferase